MYNTNMEKDEETKLSVERQKFQMKKKGMEDISSSINNVSKSVEQLANKLDPKEIGDGATFIVKGLKGDKGDKGEKGDKGDKGDKGNDGKSIKGDKGDKGEQGIPGKKGGQGLKGDKGEPGKDGKNGIDGKDGSPDTPDEIVSKLQTVKKEWLDINAIKGDFNSRVSKIVHTGGTNGAVKEINAGNNIDITGDQQTPTISLSSSVIDSINDKITGVNTHTLTVSATEPTSPSVGDIWLDIS
jgi:hypothetical protein